MSESIALSLPRTKCENVRVLFSRIRLLFGVAVELVSSTDSGFAFAAAENPVGVGGRTEMSRLILTALAAADGAGSDRTERLNYAKDYLLAACSEGGSRCERRCQYAPDVFQKLVPLRDEVERESRAMVRFEPQESLVIACGYERNVLAAIRYLDHKAQDVVTTRTAMIKAQQESPAAACREVFRQCRPHLESEDSSYDSDFENPDPSTPTQPEGGAQVGLGFHDDVSRTVSDTLAAEFAEYVTTVGGEPLRDLNSILSDPNYTSRVEFALKLGYTESQVQIALQKLGVQPSQNELLAELIKLGATSSSLGGAGSDGSSADLLASGDVQLCHKDISKTKDDLSESECGGDALTRSELFSCSSDTSNLRHIVIDGSNVAMSHGNKECFSCRGIKLCVDWFKARGHQNITVFVPRWRKEVSRPDAPIRDQEILTLLEKERLLVFTPSRHVGGRRMTCYDDRYVLRLAVDTDGVVVSNDSYKDLAAENPDYKKVIEDRLLMYSFVNDRFMPPEDPLGRHGPLLDNFLRKTPIRSSEPLPPPCPYGKKCTYGNKCKYYHPERGNQPQKSVTERLAEQAKIPLQEVKSRGLKSRESSPGDKLVCQTASGNSRMKKQPLSRTKSLVPAPCVSEAITLDRPNIVERTKSDGSSVKCQESIFGDQLTRQQQMHQQAIFQSMVPSSGFPHGSAVAWSSSIPQVSLTVSSPLSMPSIATTMASSWAALSPALPPNIPGSCAEMFLEPESGGHLFVAKRLSDPDSHGNKSSTGAKSYPTPQIHQQQSLSHETSTGNMHRKLQRQLSLNPACDPRLVQLGSYAGHHQLLSPPQEQPFNLLHQQQSEQSEQRIGAQDQLHRAFTRTPTIHQPLGRMASEGRVPNPLQAVAHVWDSVEHQTVTRISSAPDPNLHWPSLSRMQHLNSTSDTKLNMYPDLQRTAIHSALVAGGYEGGQHPWVSQGHTLEPPRPMSPIGISAMGPSKTTWQDHISSQVIGQPVRPSSVPPQGMHLGGLSLPTRPQTPEQPIDTRYKLEYHLSSIFPKDQVRAAMDMYPQETNPQKMCAVILSMFPLNG